jgi:hypothetical protein
MDDDDFDLSDNGAAIEEVTVEEIFTHSSGGDYIDPTDVLTEE